MRLLAGAVLVLALAFALAGWARAETDERVEYSAELTGVEDSGLADKIKAESRLLSQQDRPPPSLGALKRRADDDEERIRDVLRSEGYYDSRIDISIKEAERPVSVQVQVDRGPEYHLAQFAIHLDTPAGESPPQVPSLDELGIQLKSRARADAVVKAQEALIKNLQEKGYPFTKVAERKVVVDHASHEMRVDLQVSTGALARFGPLNVSGPSHSTAQWVRNRVPWKEGDRFSLSQIEHLRKRLVDARLFSAIRLTPADAPDENGLLPIEANLTEGKSRSVGIGASWSTTEGFGGQAFWEDRNFFDGAQRLRAQLTFNQLERVANVSYLEPDFLIPDQDFIASANAADQDTKAYTSRNASVSAGLSWRIGQNWRFSASTAFERAVESQDERDYNVSLISLPLELRHDSTDDLLDPTHGDRLVLTAQPFFSVLTAGVNFNRFELYDSRFLRLFSEPRIIAAGWGRAGAITGAGPLDVPPSKRLYVGGAGSVRGFGYQRAGPVSTNNTPLGGNSEISFGVELRTKVTDTIGIVPFFEGGRAFERTTPDFSQQLFWGAGIGLRYFTPIGPIRADIAFPLNPRPDIDDRFQIYLSIGQAF